MAAYTEERRKWHEANILAVRDWIDAHPEYRISLDEIVKKSGYSRAHFSREFKRLVGYNPGEYVKRRALLAAKAKIDAGALFTCDIFADIGYSSQNVFSTAFRQQFGITPAKYILKLQKENGI